MIKDYICIKTGCDMVHENMSWHGDLFWGENGFVFIPSGRNAHGITTEYLKYYFVVDVVGMVGDESVFIPLKVSKVSEDMSEFLRRYSLDRQCQLLENLGKDRNYE